MNIFWQNWMYGVVFGLAVLGLMWLWAISGVAWGKLHRSLIVTIEPGEHVLENQKAAQKLYDSFLLGNKLHAVQGLGGFIIFGRDYHKAKAAKEDFRIVDAWGESGKERPGAFVGEPIYDEAQEFRIAPWGGDAAALSESVLIQKNSEA